jgi:hypothetical protein
MPQLGFLRLGGSFGCGGSGYGADANLDDILWRERRWNGSTAYAESKPHDAMLAFAIARHWSDVFSNALEPAWVPTKMGGTGAPDDMDQAHLTQSWLAACDDPKAQLYGRGVAGQLRSETEFFECRYNTSRSKDDVLVRA